MAKSILWFELSKNDDILVHELTHVLQYVNEATFRCRAEQESIAQLAVPAPKSIFMRSAPEPATSRNLATRRRGRRR